MAYVDQHAGFRAKPVAAVALVHLVIGYALISGLATTVLKHVPAVFKVENIAEPVPPPPNDPEPLPPPRAMPRDVVTTPRTLVDVPVRTQIVPVAPVDLTAVPLPRIDPAPPTVPPSPPPSSRAASATAKGDRGGWITADDYPVRSLRNGEEGIVAIGATIGADGRVSGCTVTASSGFPALDEATCRLYQRRARFTPARDATGQTVVSTMTDRIRWTIPR